MKEIIKSIEGKIKMNFHSLVITHNSNISALCILLEIAIYRIKSREGSQLFFHLLRGLVSRYPHITSFSK